MGYVLRIIRQVSRVPTFVPNPDQSLSARATDHSHKPQTFAIVVCTSALDYNCKLYAKINSAIDNTHAHSVDRSLSDEGGYLPDSVST